MNERLSPMLSEFAEECRIFESDDDLNSITSSTEDGQNLEVRYSSKDRQIRITQDGQDLLEAKLADLKDGCYSDILETEGPDAMLQSLAQDYARDPHLFVKTQGYDFDWAKTTIKERASEGRIPLSAYEKVSEKLDEVDRFTLAQWMANEGIQVDSVEKAALRIESSRCLEMIRSFAEYEVFKSNPRLKQIALRELKTRVASLLEGEREAVAKTVLAELAKEDVR